MLKITKAQFDSVSRKTASITSRVVKLQVNQGLKFTSKEVKPSSVCGIAYSVGKNLKRKFSVKLRGNTSYILRTK